MKLKANTTFSTPQEALERVFGYRTFHELQGRVISHVMAGKDALVLMPTGGGKSLCFQIPALCLDGVTLVISPLMALMKDQVEALKANGVAAEFLNSSQTLVEGRRVEAALEAGTVKLLYISPERLFNGWTSDRLQSWNISLVAIDEAHCISFWGHDFRPEYTKLGALRTLVPGVPLIALTATADPAIRRDILSQLSIHEDGVFLSSFDRPNLRLMVSPGLKRLDRILDFLKTRKNQAGIVYCLSRAGTEDLAKKLSSYGFEAHAYHAGLSHQERSKVQDGFLKDKITVVCATVAFGMGIDKSNVRWVIHYNLPKNLEGFYQEIGRAGRDGLPSDTLLFYSFADVAQHLRMMGDGAESRKELLEAKLERMKQYAEAQVCRRRVLLSYFGETMEEDCGNCDVCSSPPRTMDGTIIAQKLLSAVYRTGGRATLKQAVLILRGSRSQDIVNPGWDQLKTFACGMELSYVQWMEYGAQLINAGYISVAYDRGMTLQLTDLSWLVLKGEKSVSLVEHTGKEEDTPLQANPKTPVGETAVNTDLLGLLKEVRKRIAAEHDIPAFVVFSDKTLKDMAARMPQSLGEFRMVHGVGETKQEHYGPIFVREIQGWVTKTIGQAT